VAQAEDVRISAQSVYIVDYQTGSVMLDRDNTFVTAEGISGAARFNAGKGRHGDYTDIR
jgi:hypothetical protein